MASSEPLPQETQPEIDVVIVNWNTADAACDAARAYRKSHGVAANVTIIDNASSDAERERLTMAAPDDVQLLLNDENVGFGRAANQALREGSAAFVCVSNADVVPEPGALAAMVEVLHSSPNAGLVGPAFADESAYHARLPSFWCLPIRPLVGGFGHQAIPSPPAGTVAAVDQPAGACFVARRSTWERVGGFDERYFLWYEDVDLARRLTDLGYGNFVTGDAIVRHAEGLATKSMDRRRHQRARLHGLAVYTKTHHPMTYLFSRPVLGLAKHIRGRR